jgi:hypothetical protein
MIKATDISKAQTQLDCCRKRGVHVYLWKGEIHITGAKPSGQQLAQLRKHEEGIRQLLGDDNRPHPWAVSQLPGGSLLYQHPRFDTGDRNPTQDDRPTAIMPFGKYRGEPLDALIDDVPYAEWLLQQRWFGEKFPHHRQYLADALRRIRADAEGPSAA